MAGLDPAIHAARVAPAVTGGKDAVSTRAPARAYLCEPIGVDGRIKSGHDENPKFRHMR